jgi:hypothetical protein
MPIENTKMKQGKCWFIVSKPGELTMNCGEFAGWTIGPEGERQYKSFCPKHQKWVDEHPDED